MDSGRTPQNRRPFYTEFAWAYDLLMDRPVRKECGAITAWLIERGVPPGSSVLDAGCGTGRYAIELARRGYRVHGMDASSEQVAEARRVLGDTTPALSLSIGDISELPAFRYDAILCRGVLNDLLDDRVRETVFAAFGRALHQAGVLVLDVREWEATRERKEREPLFRKRVATSRGLLTFTSVTTLEPTRRELLIAEEHTLETDGEQRSSDFQFVMRCWTYEELESLLHLNGFSSVAYFGAYDAAVAAGATDRLVAVAQKMGTPT
jgi:SAM-dependent methyltransferase